MEQQTVRYTLIYANGWEHGTCEATTNEEVAVWAQEVLRECGGTITGVRVSHCDGQRVDWVYEREPPQDLPWEPEVMTLREALAMANGAVTSDGRSYVGYNEDHHIDQDRPWDYLPDTASRKLETWVLLDEQLERLVLFAQHKCWVPVENFVL